MCYGLVFANHVHVSNQVERALKLVHDVNMCTIKWPAEFKNFGKLLEPNELLTLGILYCTSANWTVYVLIKHSCLAHIICIFLKHSQVKDQRTNASQCKCKWGYQKQAISALTNSCRLVILERKNMFES